MAQGPGNQDKTRPAPPPPPKPKPKPNPRTKSVDQFQNDLGQGYQDQTNPAPPTPLIPRTKSVDQFQYVPGPGNQDKTHPALPPPPKPKPRTKSVDQFQNDLVTTNQLLITNQPGQGYQDQTNPAPPTPPKPRTKSVDQFQHVLGQAYQGKTNRALLPPPKPRTKSVDQIQHVLGPVYQDLTKTVPLPLPKSNPRPKPDDIFQHVVLDPDFLKRWWTSVSPWDSLLEELKDKNENEIITVKAKRFHIAVQLFDLLMTENTNTLSNYIHQLNLIADNLDKVSNKTKVAGISGGTTAVLGGLAAGAGILFAPLTLGASLAVTVVGVGIATAGGVTGASAAIANKVNLENDKKKIKKVFQDYQDIMQVLQGCLMFIVEGMNQLAQHPLASLSNVNAGHVRLNRVVQLGGGVCPKAIEANSKASGVMQGLAMGLDVYFKDGKGETKKKLRSKCATKLRVVAQELGMGLSELVKANQESLREFRP